MTLANMSMSSVTALAEPIKNNKMNSNLDVRQKTSKKQLTNKKPVITKISTKNYLKLVRNHL